MTEIASDLSEMLQKREHFYRNAVEGEYDANLMMRARFELERLTADIARMGEDTARLDFLQRESDDLRCFSIPTGAGDADVGWRVIGHYMAEPQERVMGEVWSDDLREAIDQARERSAPPPRAALQESGR